jgi:hypothetical protein
VAVLRAGLRRLRGIVTHPLVGSLGSNVGRINRGGADNPLLSRIVHSRYHIGVLKTMSEVLEVVMQPDAL